MNSRQDLELRPHQLYLGILKLIKLLKNHEEGNNTHRLGDYGLEITQAQYGGAHVENSVDSNENAPHDSTLIRNRKMRPGN
jgi:hypothetical protein